MSASEANISTKNQPKGSAQNMSDTLDRKNEQVPPGQRQWADDSEVNPEPLSDASADLQNASARPGGQAQGGITPHPGDPTDPEAARARADRFDEERSHHR
jgi:hypothetical protein